MTKKIITARIDEEVGHQIDFLKSYLGKQNTTYILTEAIKNLYLRLKEEEAKQSPFELLEKLNLIGCFEGEQSLSQNYKSELTKSLSQKHKMKKKHGK